MALLHAPAAKAASYTVVYSFCGQKNCTDGQRPYDGLINVGGTLYGTTFYGGGSVSGCSCGGTVFKIDPTTGAETVLHSFGGVGVGDGQSPDASLINVGGILYGTTANGGGTQSTGNCGNHGGGEGGCGVVFSINPTTGKEEVVYSFCSQKNCKDGQSPLAGLINVGGILYGTTPIGGASATASLYGNGTVFKVDPRTGAETVVYSFGRSGTDGARPYAGLIDVGGTLYGTTSEGGTDNSGTVFSINPTTGAETVLYRFMGDNDGQGDGGNPHAGLINVGATLYGTTNGGGAHDAGSLFKVDPTSGDETVLYSFGSYSGDGTDPNADLIDVGGTLYGTTSAGGANSDYGTVFSFDLKTAAETVLYSFCSKANCKDGYIPSAGLINVGGALYSTTPFGGAHAGDNGGAGCNPNHCGGTVFKITP